MYYWRPSGEGNTAALQFMLGRLGQLCEWKHAIQSRRSVTPARRHHGDMYTTYVAGSVSLTYLCDVTSESGVHFSAKGWWKHCENVKMASKMNAIEHIVRTKLPKRVHKQEIHIFPIDFANSRCHKQPQNGDIPCNWRAWEALFDMIIHLCSFQNHAPQRGREAVSQQKWKTFERKGGVKHSRHKENIRSHAKVPKSQMLCIHLLLQSGLGG